MVGSKKLLPTMPWDSGYRPVTSVQWLGKVTLGKLGVMNRGESPEATKAVRVGVRCRERKSARKPSREMRIVVGRKACVPLESVAGRGLTG